MPLSLLEGERLHKSHIWLGILVYVPLLVRSLDNIPIGSRLCKRLFDSKLEKLQKNLERRCSLFEIVHLERKQQLMYS